MRLIRVRISAEPAVASRLGHLNTKELKMKFAPALILNLFIASAQAAPPYYYGKTVKIINKDSIYYRCSGVVEAWEDSAVVVSNLCGDYKRDTFKDADLELKCKGNKCSF